MLQERIDMKKTMKRISAIAMVLVMAVTFMPMLGSGGKVFASTYVSPGQYYTTAPLLTLGKEYTSTAMDKYYYFKFKTTGNSHVDYRIWSINYSTDNYIKISLYDKDGDKIGSVLVGHDGKPDYEDFSKLKRNETYYLCVDKGWGYDCDYVFKVSQRVPKPARVSLTSIKGAKKSIKVRYGSVPFATKYQIQYRLKGASKWSPANSRIYTNNTYYTIKNLKKKRTYQVRVRAIRVVDGKNYYGAWGRSAATTR